MSKINREIDIVDYAIEIRYVDIVTILMKPFNFEYDIDDIDTI